MTVKPARLGRYEILDTIGKGSMGVVYKGLDSQIGKVVAIKTMNQKILEDAEMQERFYREGSILGQLQHRNIIHVYNVGEDQDICYIAMEYLDGVPLDRVIKQKKHLSRRKMFTIVKQVCEGVHIAHQQSIIHRDLKPANIFLMNGDHVKVLDFGVAHFQNSQLTNSGVLIGTINYIAPEQITGLRVDHRVDIFSIGVILFELLTKSNPFVGNNISQTMLRIINTEPAVPEDLPEHIRQVLLRALAKDRDKRYATCKELAKDLEGLLREENLDDSISEEIQLSDEVVAAQEEFLNTMVRDRVKAIKVALKQGKLDEMESLIDQLAEIRPSHPELAKMRTHLKKERKRAEEKRQFIHQLAHEMLQQAHAMMAERNYIRAIEICQNVLKEEPRNQDARVIKAACIKKLERYLQKLKAAELGEKTG